jgi:mannose-6-phosphate isomerase-like protein (cupin superfamily)
MKGVAASRARSRREEEIAMGTSQVETIVDGLEPIALIVRAAYDEPGIRFFTPPAFSQQLAVMRHPKGKHIGAHVHNLVTRQVLYTQEVLWIRKGRVRVNLFTSAHAPLATVELGPGDLILLCGGGHSFDMLEETAMVEVKQGPYAGEGDKSRFEEKA